MPSIVDPAEKRGGAWAVTSGLIKAMESAWPNCSIDLIATPSSGRLNHRVRQAGSVVASIAAGGFPAKMRFTRTRSMRHRVREALRRRVPELAVINGSDVLWARSEIPPHVPVIVVVHNLEHVLYRRQIANLRFGSSTLARVLDGDARRLETVEIDGFSSAAGTIFLSEEDLEAARDLIGNVTTFVVPPLFEYEPHPRSSKGGDRLRLGMFADFEWWPNRVGLTWFIENVWPEVSRHCELHLLGHGSENAAGGVDGITRHGFVPEARDAFAACDLMIAPITDGGGIKVKVAEALYNRVPVLATPASVSRVFTLGNPALRICATPREWIDCLKSSCAVTLSRETIPDRIRDSFSVEGGAKLLRGLYYLLPHGGGGAGTG